MQIQTESNHALAGYIARSALMRPGLRVITEAHGEHMTIVKIDGPSKALKSLILSIDDSLDLGGGFEEPSFLVKQRCSDHPFAASWLKLYTR